MGRCIIRERVLLSTIVHLYSLLKDMDKRRRFHESVKVVTPLIELGLCTMLDMDFGEFFF
jgi:energy-converting hydrogenase Eha subunit A